MGAIKVGLARQTLRP